MNPALKSTTEFLLSQFEDAFPCGARREVHVSRAPGRVNLIGEHTDYNEGFVMPGAIAFDTRVACAANESGRLSMRSLQQRESFVFSIGDDSPKPRHDWTDYVRGVQIELTRMGYAIKGADLLVDGCVPMNAGLSSSAALEVAAALALLRSAGSTLGSVELAQLCQRAENEFVGARCGIMDQFSSVSGRVGHAILLDCRSLEASYVPLLDSVEIVICNTMVKHSVAAGEYNRRRAECEECVKYFRSRHLEIASLRDLSDEDFGKYGSEPPDVLRRRCRHVITENSRVLRAASAFESKDPETVGRLMYESHASLRDDYEVSCPELDLMVDLAKDLPGVCGSRMTGGGFGGCTVSLVERDAVEKFKNEISAKYEHATRMRPEIYVTPLVDGAGMLQ
ncbi:MAG: galactokinase [Candidatus Sulfotelmatobacter sp.]